MELVKHTGLKVISDNQKLLTKIKEARKYIVDTGTFPAFIAVNNQGLQIHF